MINNNTIIVVGAGGSAEVELPTGDQLKAMIGPLLDIRFKHGIELVSGDYIIHNALKIAVQRLESDQDINPYLHAAWLIRDAMPQALSIDNFIDSHKNDKKIELCGKLAIVRAILSAERESRLFIDRNAQLPQIDFSDVETTWFNRFFQILTENCQADGLQERFKNICLIIFNYDRCVEHFLFHALQNYYHFDKQFAAELVYSIDIFHPYGTVGSLPWMSRENAINFGAEPNPNQLVDLASQIRTFTEGTDPNTSQIGDIHSRLSEGQLYLFLGFAFHALNMKLLKHNSNGRDGKRVFATARGISDHDCNTIKDEIIKMGITPLEEIQLRNELSCYDIFQEYWRTFSIT